MKSVPILFTFLCLIFCAPSLIAQNGIIKGRVIDARTQEGISFANVLVEGINTGASTDIDGYYTIEGLSPNIYNITASYLGYRKQTVPEIQVTNSKPAEVNFELKEDSESLGTVEVTTAAFYKSEESPVSLRTIGTTEIARNPGGGRDVSKVIRILPGVTTSSPARNDLLIRGGGPAENRFYLDDVEIPNINHFSTQGASGGPNSLLNVDFIREVDFYSGAFPANRGNSLSSVFNFKQKNGRDDRLGFTFTSGTSEVALSLEGPLSKNKKTTFLVSARQSFLQLLFKLIDLPFLPTYNDFQFKVRTKINENNEFYVIGLGALDNFKLNLEANKTPNQRYLLASLPVFKQWSYSLGAVYKYYKNNNAWTFVLSRNMLNNLQFKHIDNDESQLKYIDYLSQESENKFRAENTRRFGNWKLNYGIGYEFTRFTTDSRNILTINNQATTVLYNTLLNMHKYNAFGQISNTILDENLTLSFGLRLDGNSYNKAMANPFTQASPRISISYAINPAWSINFNTGVYYQLPSYTTLGYKQNNEFVNKDRLEYTRAAHIVGGVEYQTKTNTKFAVEFYHKYYTHYPFLLNQMIAFANVGNEYGVVGNAPADSRGIGRATGLEFMIQQRLFKGYYGILSYTLGKTEFQDNEGNYVPSTWDSRHIINLSFGKNWMIMNEDKFKARNEKLIAAGKAAKTKKVVTQTLDLGFNARVQTGLPYTPFNLEASALVSNWDVLGKGILDYSQLNQGRSNAFYSFDFRVDYKWFFPKWSFNLYLDIQNFPGVSSGNPVLILDQGQSGNDPVQIINAGQPNAAYRLSSIKSNKSTMIPTLGIVIQY